MQMKYHSLKENRSSQFHRLKHYLEIQVLKSDLQKRKEQAETYFRWKPVENENGSLLRKNIKVIKKGTYSSFQKGPKDQKWEEFY